MSRPETTEDDLQRVRKQLEAEGHIHPTGDLVRYSYAAEACPEVGPQKGWDDRFPVWALLYSAVKDRAVQRRLLLEEVAARNTAEAELERLRSALAVVGAALVVGVSLPKEADDA